MKSKVRRVLILLCLLSTVASAAGSVQAGGLICAGQPVTHPGTAADDTIRGTAGDDVMAAGGGDDVVYGFKGRDSICANGGNDIVYGGPNRDRLSEPRERTSSRAAEARTR